MANIRSRKERIIEPIDNVEDQIDCSVKNQAGQVNTTDEFVIEHLGRESLKVEDDAMLDEGEHYEKRGVVGVAEEVVEPVDHPGGVLQRVAHVEHEGDEERHQELHPVVVVRYPVLQEGHQGQPNQEWEVVVEHVVRLPLDDHREPVRHEDLLPSPRSGGLNTLLPQVMTQWPEVKSELV